MKRRPRTPTPYGLTVTESCFGCVFREEGLFCRLPQPVLAELNSLRQTSLYPAGALLFVQGEPPRGVFILCSGEAKLTASSEAGRSVTLRRVSPGEVLGLSSIIGNTLYPATAEVAAPSQVSFVPRQGFLRFLRSHAEVAGRVAEHLSMELHKAWEQVELLALSPTTRAKLVLLLLTWAERHGSRAGHGVRIAVPMTQEEIGNHIGTTRETVSRLLADLRHRGLIRTKGSSIQLMDPEALRQLVKPAA